MGQYVFGGYPLINSKYPPRSIAPSAHCSGTNLPVIHSLKGSFFLLAPTYSLSLSDGIETRRRALEDPGKIPEKWKPIFLYDVPTAAKCEL